MLKSFKTSLVALFSVFAIGQVAEAAPNAFVQFSQPLINGIALQSQVSALSLSWKVGDRAEYKMAGGFINGTVKSFVREDIGNAMWVQQDMDMGFLGKQKVEILFDKATGQILKLLANGQEQSLPDTSNIEVIETKEATVTVPAGTFAAIYAKIRDNSNNQVQEAWINPKEVPINGMVKAIADSQLGKITQELTAKSFAP
ncbi:MAG: hypothetical protein RBT63_07775 [Bdellovibrionales bacterium]|jgi:hypothetical protein|nr:hypothetical protein [Bdellovibrionales bacterium]